MQKAGLADLCLATLQCSSILLVVVCHFNEILLPLQCRFVLHLCLALQACNEMLPGKPGCVFFGFPSSTIASFCLNCPLSRIVHSTMYNCTNCTNYNISFFSKSGFCHVCGKRAIQQRTLGNESQNISPGFVRSDRA